VSRRNKKKRLSRKFRKLHHIGKPEFIETQRTEATSIESPKEEKATPIISAKSSGPEAKKPVYLSFEQAKSQEILGNIKLVLSVSILCLLLLGILYFFELRGDWVAGVNEWVKGLLSGWTW